MLYASSLPPAGNPALLKKYIQFLKTEEVES